MIVATITQAAGGSRVRVVPAQLILDAKATIGMGGGANTAYGPQMNERLRAFAIARGVAASELPAASSAAAWQRNPELPATVVRLLVWAAYAHGMPLSAVSVESASGLPRWGVAVSGARSPAQREPLSRQSVGATTPATPATPERQAPPAATQQPASTSSDPTPPAAESPAPNASDTAGACIATMPAAWHLRETETAASEGRAYPTGERVELLRAVPGVTRGATERFFRVRVVSDRREGFAFIPSAAVPSCAPAAGEGAPRGGLSVETQATLKLAGKIVGGVVGTTLTLAIIAAVMRRRQRARIAHLLRAPAPPAVPTTNSQPKASRST